MKDKFIKNGIEYVRQGDYYIPNLTVPDETEYQIGKYGSLRRTFLKEHHNWLYSTLLMQGTFLKHLAETDETCHSTLKDMMSKMAEQEAETELKAAYKGNFSRDTFKDSIRLTDNELHEDLYTERFSITRKLKAYRKQHQEQTYPKPRHKELNNEMEL